MMNVLANVLLVAPVLLLAGFYLGRAALERRAHPPADPPVEPEA
jgi:hypothetical protein